MKSPLASLVWTLACLSLCGATACQHDASDLDGHGTAPADMQLLEPEQLAQILEQPDESPLLFHVGYEQLYQQAHIPGSEFFGPASEPDNLELLRQRVADLPRTADIVIYCGCCLWERCSNVKPAYEALQDLGFTEVKALFIPQNLGADWVDKGYPVSQGE